MSALRRLLPARTSLITCRGKTDGIGAQAHACLSTLLFAHDMGLTYAHTPFETVSHAPSGDSDWTSRWERFFDIGAGRVHADALDEAAIHRWRKRRPPLLWRQPNALYTVSHCHHYADCYPDRYRHVTRPVRDHALAFGRNLPRHAAPDTIHVAVHIRRGDVNGGPRHLRRFTPNDRVVGIVDRLRPVLERNGARVAVHVYSQGRIDDFGELARREIHWHLDESAFETLSNLIRADVLVLSKSSFSYTAALLSAGLKVYEPFWHSPMSDWIVVPPDGSLDTRRLEVIPGRCAPTGTYSTIA